ncbi:hypothetical protein RFI_39571 [Reticulomyxa filosa]|uniref:Pentapeptide repeat-containing protein n=1 Tax=Reticulomyxa filosa TaxID=46433 RepID=X6L9D9_RETFI|nr:hypothetical protein RFI_39571 [Reticulomyxa filosa]|eukprot:ETN97950.1 hypothetical protein RFI_39571 [Reticulomyxa filosa]
MHTLTIITVMHMIVVNVVIDLLGKKDKENQIEEGGDQKVDELEINVNDAPIVRKHWLITLRKKLYLIFFHGNQILLMLIINNFNNNLKHMFNNYLSITIDDMNPIFRNLKLRLFRIIETSKNNEAASVAAANAIAIITSANVNMHNQNWKNIKISYAVLDHAFLEGTDLTNANLDHVRFI